MLHISDIEKRLKVCPEPPEVKEMRHKVINAFKNLEFFEEPHEYILHKENGENVKLPSVSSIVQRFEPHVDWDVIRANKAKKLGITDDELKRQWEENNLTSTSNGSIVHLFGESCLYFFQGRLDMIEHEISHYHMDKGYMIPYGPKEIAASKLYEDLLDNYNVFPVMAESKIYTGVENAVKSLNLNEEYCGTFDILWANKEKNGSFTPMILDFKGLPLDTPILTPNGFVNMGDLQEGDIVYDKNGKPTKIKNISTIHNNPCYKITFDDSYSIVSDIDHRWEVYFYNTWKKNYEAQVMTTAELEKYLKNLPSKKRYGYKIPKIMVNKPIDMPNKTLPIDPYVLGAWLGDGSKACGIITNMYDELFKEIESRGFSLGEDVSQGNSGRAKERTVYGLQTLLRKNNILNNKHIPEIYLTASYSQRMDLLMGIMDTDGYYNPVRKRYVITQSDKQVVDSIDALLSTLGIKSTVLPTKKHYKDKDGNKREFDSFDICFWSDEYPFKIRDIVVERPKINKYFFRNIRNIEQVETVQTKCIEVESETHTYLATKKLIVTHNTNKSLSNDYNRAYGKMMLPPFDDMVDEPLSHYTIQLSAYAMGLEQIGINVKHMVLIWLKDDGTYEKIPVKDVRDRLKEVL